MLYISPYAHDLGRIASLLLSSLNLDLDNDFVMIFVTCSTLIVYSIMRYPIIIFFEQNRSQFSIWFMCEWSIGCLARCPTLILSQKIRGELEDAIYNSTNPLYIQHILSIVWAKDQNSIFVEYLKTTFCFPKLHEMREFSI